MKRIAPLLMIVLFLIGLGGASWADPRSEEDGKAGLYIQGSFAMIFPTSDIKESLENADETTTFLGGSIAAGYFLTEMIAVEGRLQFVSWRTDGMPSQGIQEGLRAAIYEAVVKLYPLSGSDQGLIQPYVLAGVGGQSVFAENVNSLNSFLFEIGAGVDIMFDRNLGVFAEIDYQLLTIDDSNGNQAALNMGVTYRF